MYLYPDDELSGVRAVAGLAAFRRGRRLLLRVISDSMGEGGILGNLIVRLF